MKKAILFGNYDARYHSAQGVDEHIREILKEDASLDYSEDRSLLNTETLSQYDLVISYFEFGGDRLSDDQTAALIRYVAGGGSFLVIHNGISLQNREEIAQLIGAKFTHHPGYDTLPQIPFKVSNQTHPITAGLSDFVMGDEPYMFIMDELDGKELLMEYEYEDKIWPSGWTRPFGKGKVVYLSGGHNLDGFLHPTFSTIVCRSAQWCLGNL